MASESTFVASTGWTYVSSHESFMTYQSSVETSLSLVGASSQNLRLLSFRVSGAYSRLTPVGVVSRWVLISVLVSVS